MSDKDFYDFPKYYDLVFGSDWKAEFDFLLGCFERHASGTVRRVFEPACGTGRLLYRLADAGYEVAGCDLKPSMIDFCNGRLRRRGHGETSFVADMTDFKLPRKVDAAFNTINSFRHVPGEQGAHAHLQCVADSLRKGGIYVLGLHLTPTTHEPIDEESWSARRGHLSIITRVWTKQINRRKRQELVGMAYDIYTPTNIEHLENETTFRTYTAAQMEQLIAGVPSLEIAETYDFAYDLQEPIEIDSDTEDVIYVLKKK
jgi:SAM-dependent methyltransferase